MTWGGVGPEGGVYQSGGGAGLGKGWDQVAAGQRESKRASSCGWACRATRVGQSTIPSIQLHQRQPEFGSRGPTTIADSREETQPLNRSPTPSKPQARDSQYPSCLFSRPAAHSPRSNAGVGGSGTLTPTEAEVPHGVLLTHWGSR